MATSKLNPSAPPFPPPSPLHLGPPAPPPVMLPYHAPGPAVGSGAVYYFCPQVKAVPSPHPAFIRFPILHQSRAFCKTGPVPPSRLLRKGAVPAKPAAQVVRKGAVPAQATMVPCLAVPAQPERVLPEDVCVPAPCGLPPHKLFKDATDVALVGGCRHEPNPAPDDASAAAAPDQKPVERLARRKTERHWRKKKTNRDGAVVGPRAVRATPRVSTWKLASAFTTPREAPLPPQLSAHLGSCTTLMIRNIPNKLSGDQIIALLDEHCAHTNRAAAATTGEDVVVVSAYDVVYLPMDFGRLGNFGYAFVNFTTADGARLLFESLHGRGWKLYESRKTIEVVRAKIQGKDALVRMWSRHTFECKTEEYLPAVFTPARDGGVSATATTTTRVGKLVPPPPPRRRVTRKSLFVPPTLRRRRVKKTARS